MIELRRIKDMTQWWHPSSNFVPTANLTAGDKKRLAERDAILDKLAALTKSDEIWLKLNTGIFRGSIVPAALETGRFSDGPTVNAIIDNDNVKRMNSGGPSINVYTSKLDRLKGWQWADRSLTLSTQLGNKPIGFKEGTIYPVFFAHAVTMDASLLLDYQGDRVYNLNTAKRPLVFQDRLEQDVTIGDLVVVARNYGVGLDICIVKGFGDERRIVIESVIDGEQDRIALEDNATLKVMRMPNSLKDTAIMLKLAKK